MLEAVPEAGVRLLPLDDFLEHHDPTIRRYDHRNMGKRDSLPAVCNRRDRVRERCV